MSLPPENAAVPRFSSFKPKVRQQDDDPRLIDTENDSRSPRPASKRPMPISDKHEKGHHQRTSQSLHKFSGHHQHGRTEYEQGIRHLNGVTPKKELVLEDDIGLFFIDKTGDPDDLRYGRPHRYSVPDYRLFGHGNILGASKIPPDAKARVKLISSNQATEAYVIPRKSTNNHFDTESDFVDFETQSRKRRKTNDFTDSPDESDEADHYRSVEGKKLAQVIDSPLTNLASREQTNLSDAGLEKRQHLARLSRLAEENPTDIERWITLIEYQDQMKSSSATKAEIRSLTDIKISIYENAIAKVGRHRSRDRLLVGLLEEGSKLWDNKRLAARWQSVLDENSDYISLWIRYLDFQQTSFLTFSFEECQTVYLRALEKASNLPPSCETDQIRVYLFLRFTSFLISSGFSEQAVALWQSVLEYTFLKPQSEGQYCSLDAFSDFWESEVARIGEQDAKGWRSQDEAAMVDPKTDQSAEKLEANHLRLFENWAKCESERVIKARMPARMTDDVEEDDPYRVILWSDIRDFVFEPSSEAGRAMLVNAFCNFCGLPPIESENGLILGWWSDPFLVCEKAVSAWFRKTDGLRTTQNDQSSAKQSRLVFPLTQMFPDISTLSSSRDEPWFSQWTDASLHDDDDVPLDFKLRSFRLLSNNLLSNDGLAEYTVALQFQIAPQEAKKLARGLLKKRPNSLRLYNTYALTERRSGNEEAAERVWSTALSMSKTFSEQDRHDSIILWRTWIWDALEARRLKKGLKLLITIPTGQVDVSVINDAEVSAPSPLDSLAAQRYLQSHQEHALSQRHYYVALHYTDLLALLAYLTNTNRALDRVLDIYNSSFPLSAAGSTTNSGYHSEAVAQSLARIVHLYATTAPIHQPKETLNHLSLLLQLHPTNTLILSLYHYHSQHLILTDRIRSLIPESRQHYTNSPSSNSIQTNSIIPALVPVVRELSRPSTSGSTQHSVHAAFESAVAAYPSSPFLWDLYLEWSLSVPMTSAPFPSSHPENRNKNLGDEEVKALVYRILRATPWACKGLVLKVLGGKKTSGLFSWEEKKALWEVLGEKGVRVHVDLGAALEEMGE